MINHTEYRNNSCGSRWSFLIVDGEIRILYEQMALRRGGVLMLVILFRLVRNGLRTGIHIAEIFPALVF